MAVTVVDKLIVTLGLDPKEFTAGRKKAAAEFVELRGEVKRSTDDMGSNLAGFTKKFLGIATVAIAVRKLVGVLADASTMTRRLGIDADNYNMAAHKMRNFQNAVELFGGDAKEATATVAGLQKAVFDLTVMGQSSGALEMLTRLGVKFQDDTGRARDFNSILLDTADALERVQKSGAMNRTEAFFAAKQAGFDEGTARLMLSGRASVAATLADRGGLHQVNAQDLAAAEATERLRARASQFKDATAVQALGVGGVAAENVQGMYKAAVENTTDAMVALDGAVRRVAGSLTVGGISASLDKGMTVAERQAKYQSTVDAAAKKYGIDPAMFMGLLRQESQLNSGAVSPAGAVGIAQLMPKYFPGAGKNPHDDIFTAAKELRRLHDSFVRSGDADSDGAWNLARQAYNAGETRVRNARSGKGPPLAQETLEYNARVMRQAQMASPTPGVSAGRGGNTTVHVGGVQIITPATDANGIARDIGGAVQRNLQAAQAETGMQ